MTSREGILPGVCDGSGYMVGDRSHFHFLQLHHWTAVLNCTHNYHIAGDEQFSNSCVWILIIGDDRGPIVYIFHYFPLMYKFCTLFVHFWSCTLMYIGFHQEKKYKGYRFKTSQLSTIVAGISKHSNHLGFKNPSFFCDVLWIPNVAESFSDEILHHGFCNSFTEIKKAVITQQKKLEKLLQKKPKLVILLK